VNKPVIVSTLYNRPRFTRMLLEALSNCHEVGKYSYWAFAEPDQPGVVEQLWWAYNEGFFGECHWVVNKHQLGVRLNMQQALTRGFTMSDHVIVLEDDCIPSPDALRYFEWALAEYENDGEIFSVTGYYRPGTIPLTPNELATHSERECAVVRQRCYFHPWGWATWKDRWAKVAWALPGVSWDVQLLHYVQQNGLYEVYPVVPRVKNIDECRKQHCNGWAWAGNWQLAMVQRWVERE